MRFTKDTPKVNSLNALDNFKRFLQLGQHEFYNFLKNFLIAYFPYVLRGRYVKKYLEIKSFLPKLAEAISDQITLCYLQEFKGGDWLFGENLAKIIVSNCISTKKYDGIKFAHLIEKMEQLAASTFESQFFSTGVIVCTDPSKYRNKY